MLNTIQTDPETKLDKAVVLKQLKTMALFSQIKSSWREIMTMSRSQKEPLDADIRTVIAKVIRDEKPSNKTTFLLIHSVEMIAEDRHFEMYCNQYSSRFKAIEKAHDLPDDWEFIPGEEPEETLALRAEFEQACDQLVIDTFLEYEEEDLANLYREDREAYDRLREAGRLVVHAPEARGGPTP